jgi:hypothetical protein
MSAERDDSVRDDVYSRAVRAGKRTYFFDIKATRGNDLYITITESKKKLGDNGQHPSFEKHKIFLYKEDFDKFMAGLKDTLDKLVELRDGDNGYVDPVNSAEHAHRRSYTDVRFEDLDS